MDKEKKLEPEEANENFFEYELAAQARERRELIDEEINLFDRLREKERFHG